MTNFTVKVPMLTRQAITTPMDTSTKVLGKRTVGTVKEP